MQRAVFCRSSSIVRIRSTARSFLVASLALALLGAAAAVWPGGTLVLAQESKTGGQKITDLSDQKWHWTDPKSDADHSISGGTITIKAPNGNDLSGDPGKNFDAPRLTKEVSGDFVMQVRIRASFSRNCNHAGLVVGCDRNTLVRFEKFPDNIWIMFFDKGKRASRIHSVTFPESDLKLKLVRIGKVITGYAAPQGGDWITIGSVQTNLPETVQAGIHLLNMFNNTVFKAEFSEFSLVKKDPALNMR